MKINNFNKIGGTEYRVSNQINGYISFANYVVEAQFLSRFRVNNDLDFKE
jgi:hypothetical protein